MRVTVWLVALTVLWPLAVMGQSGPVVGSVLVARETIADPMFRHTVLVLVQRDKKGDIGLILNRPGGRTVGELLPEFAGLAGSAEPVYFGGPVEPRVTAYLLRGAPGAGAHRQIYPGVYLGMDRAGLRAALGKAGQTKLRVFAGRSTWQPGQLEHELLQGQWWLLKGEPALLFDVPADELWPRLSRELRRHWAGGPMPGH